MRLLFVSILNENVASHRFRVLKILPFLREMGIKTDVMCFNQRMEIAMIPRLALDLLRHRNQPRIVVFQKTCAFSLAILARRMGASCLMDVDDGSMHRIDGSVYPVAVRERFLKWSALMDAIVVSCDELAKWLRTQMQKNIGVIPTCLDVGSYGNIAKQNNGMCRIGWVGSTASNIYLSLVRNALDDVTKSHACEVLIVSADKPDLDKLFHARFLKWSLALEPEIFSQFDIGIMPLPDNERSRMKAGFKMLQYMASGLPVVASPVGINKKIVRHGWNGFLASSPDEWKTALSRLIEEPGLRQKMGQNGRTFVTKHFCLEVAAELWRKVCENVIAQSPLVSFDSASLSSEKHRCS